MNFLAHNRIKDDHFPLLPGSYPQDMKQWFEVSGDLDDFIFYNSPEKEESER